MVAFIAVPGRGGHVSDDVHRGADRGRRTGRDVHLAHASPALPKWTPDGKALSFLVSQGERRQPLSIQPSPAARRVPSPSSPKARSTTISGCPSGKRVVLQRTSENVSNLWSAGTDGRAPEPITDFATGSIFALDAAKDGKTIYFLYGNESTDIVLLKNFR
jgi:Tol biopolymer transport system component